MKNICFQMTRKAWLALAFLLCLTFPALAQKITVTGTVIDNLGEPLMGASILAEGTSTGVATDLDGNFTIQVEPNATLIVSYIGYNTEKVPVDGRTNITITMSENSVVLNEVVAIGYGVVKKSDATGSVSVVKPDEIEAGISTSVQDMLVGQTPGVVVTTGGGPEGKADIRIRGGSSLSASNDPLIVIDGVPLSNDGVQGMSNPLAMISPESIESMTVLKDASATAIYGSRASNGVIIITTKKGQSGKPQVTFSANFYVDTPRKLYDVLSADEYRALLTKYYGAESNAVATLGKHSTDWQKEVTRTTFSSDYALSVSGTSGVLPYRLSATYTNSNGILLDTQMDRASIGATLTPKFFDNHLSVTANVKAYYIQNQFAANAIGGALSFNPTAPVYQDYNIVGGNSGLSTLYNGYYGIIKSNGQLEENAAKNPLASVKDISNTAHVFRSNGNLQLDYSFHFLPELHANLNIGYDVTATNEFKTIAQNSPTAWLAHDKTGAGYREKIHQNTTNKLLEFYLNYNKDVESIKSNFDVTAGYSWQRFERSGWNLGATSNPGMPTTIGFYNPEYDAATGGYILNINPDTENKIGHNFAEDQFDENGNYHWANRLQLLSFYGRLNYKLMERYLLTVTVRGDATSRFSPDNRWGIFPAVALAWRINEESFMEGAQTWLSDWKLRLGWGVTGQQEVGSTNNYLPQYMGASQGSYYPAYVNGQLVYLSPYYLIGYNPNLKWESTTTWNAGFDFGFLNNRITATVEGYYRKTTDLQSFVTVAAGSSTTNQLFMNIGSLENYGVEFNITARPIVTKNFTWTLAYNVGYNHNEITELYDNTATIKTGGISGGNGNSVQAHRVGYAANTFYLLEQVYGQDGMPLEGVYVDQNGDGLIDDADLVLRHSKDPKVIMSLNSQFRYKQWDFGFNLRASLGNYVYNNIKSNNNRWNNLYSAYGHYNVVRNEIYFENQQYLSDYWLENASYLRCDNITLGYTWENLLQNRLKLRLFGSVQNPFVITKYSGNDPEIFSGIDNDVYTKATTYSLGLVATF